MAIMVPRCIQEDIWERTELRNEDEGGERRLTKSMVLSETLDPAMLEARPVPEHPLLESGNSLYPPNLS